MGICWGKHDFPNTDMSDAECLEEFVFRRDTRIKYPRAFALKYKSIGQVVLKVLFGWDSTKQQGNKSILGTLIAYADTHKEQGRFVF